MQEGAGRRMNPIQHPHKVDEQWLSEQIHKYGLQNPHLFGCADGDFLEFEVNGKTYSIEIEQVVERESKNHSTVSGQPPVPGHCDHECVCHLFIQNCFTGSSPCLEPCKDDTRSRPVHQQQEQAVRDQVLELLRPDVLHFALSMEKKLRKHDDRDGWKDCGIDWLFARLMDEVKELGADVKKYTKMNPRSSYVAREADDVGNFAMMIHSNTTDTTIDGLVEELRQSAKESGP
jgi:NTP pyrophosphatase (non-canonical NTP hydrolase)